jgi:hypothetical protein
MASGEKITNKRINAQWQVAATLNMGNASNALLAAMKAQPDGAYAEADMNEWLNWLKLTLGNDGSLAKWFPNAVYQGVLGKIQDYNYNATKVSDLFLPPENAAGGSGECSCDSDAYGDPARDVLCFKWDFVDFTEQAAGSEAGGTWTFSGLASGNYVLAFADYATAESFPTTYLTVT